MAHGYSPGHWRGQPLVGLDKIQVRPIRRLVAPLLLPSRDVLGQRIVLARYVLTGRRSSAGNARLLTGSGRRPGFEERADLLCHLGPSSSALAVSDGCAVLRPSKHHDNSLAAVLLDEEGGKG